MENEIITSTIVSPIAPKDFVYGANTNIAKVLLFEDGCLNSLPEFKPLFKIKKWGWLYILPCLCVLIFDFNIIIFLRVCFPFLTFWLEPVC